MLEISMQHVFIFTLHGTCNGPRGGRAQTMRIAVSIIRKILGCAQKICDKSMQKTSMAIEYMAKDVISFYTYCFSKNEQVNRKVCQ